MKLPTLSGRLRETSALVALSATAIFGCATPGATAVHGIYGGGSTLASQVMRQLFDCYSGVKLFDDDFQFISGALHPGHLPATCTTTTQHNTTIESLYAAVGSGSGQAAFFGNNPNRLLQSNAHVPAVPPPFIDGASGDSNFSEYPYPRIDFGAGDSPLGATGANGNGFSATFGDLTSTDWTSYSPTTSWQTLTSVTVGATFTVTYPQPTMPGSVPTTWGNPIQIPMFEAGVAIILNVGGLSIQTGLGAAGAPNTSPGGAIALTTAQLCAIFSGLVTDWNDSATPVPYINSTGHQVASDLFWHANAFTNTGPTAVLYSMSSVPIKVTFRSDGSGTTFILTNYLQSSCPQLDGLGSTSGIYHSIFQTPGVTSNTLPSTSFTKLIASVNAYWQANGRGTSYDITPTWDGKSGSQSLAIEVGDTTSQPTHGGYIGYVSDDFSIGYSNLTDPPLSASLQDEAHRLGAHYYPASTGAGKFVAPTATSVDNGFHNLASPSTTSSWANWDLYGITYAGHTGHGTHGGVFYDPISELGLANQASAYPIVGTTFAYLYSCYAVAADANRVGDFLAWLLTANVSGVTGLPAYNSTLNNRSNPGKAANVTAILANNGFHALNSTLSRALLTEYVVPSATTFTHIPGSATAISDTVTATDGCTGVTTGANPGAM